MTESNETLFGSDADKTVATELDPKTVLDSLVGEGKKFSTVEALAAGKLEADNFITQMQKEHKELREELDKALTVEEVYEKIKTERELLNVSTPEQTIADRLATEQANNQSQTELPTGLTQEDVLKLLQDDKQNATQSSNMASVVDSLKKQYGTGYTAVLDNVQSKYGVSKDYLDKLAKEQPAMLLDLVRKSNTVVDNSSPVSSTITTTSVNLSTTSGPSPFDKHQEVRRKDPRLYTSPAYQMRMHAEAKQLGDAFYKR